MIIAMRVDFEVLGNNKGVPFKRKYFASNLTCVMMIKVKVEYPMGKDLIMYYVFSEINRN